MTITTKNLVPGKHLEATQTAQYTASGVKGVIDKCVITNTTAVEVKISINIVKKSTSAAATNLILTEHIIAGKETYLCPEIIGVVLENGDFISTLAGAASSLAINISGREIS